MYGHYLFQLLEVVAIVTTTQTLLPDYCKLPPLSGPCRASITRYYFDAASTQDCKEFSYGGCNGNANNFQSLAECRSACVCNLNFTNALSCMPPYFRIYYNYTQASCMSAVYGTCGAAKKSFPSYIDCLETCSTSACYHLPAAGKCRSAMTQYFYNTTSRACEKFTYGGCEGNPNRFSTLEDCSRQCAGPISAASSRARICSLSSARGSCAASIPRYFYSSKTQACEIFTYTGCQGNENNFEKEEDCRAFCLQADRSLDLTDVAVLAAKTTVKPSK